MIYVPQTLCIRVLQWYHCRDCQKFEKRNSNYGLLPAKDYETSTPWHIVYTGLIVTYTILAKFRHPGNKILMKELQRLCMDFIDSETGWFEISEVSIIDQSSARISWIFNEVWLSRYPRPRKVIFDNFSESNRKLIPLLKYVSVKPICITIKNP